MPKMLSPSLLQRLEEIAVSHEGMVPLHGRLFLQWMHHVYPRECPFPHLSGTTNPLTRQEMKAAGTAPASTRADKETMEWHVEQATKVTKTADAEIPWSMEDERFIWSPKKPAGKRVGFVRGVMS